MKKFFATLLSIVISLGVMAQGTITRPSSPKPTITVKQNKHSTVKISEPNGFIGNHGYIDLGLPSGLKWATCNIGASSPFDYGNYYAWGEIVTKTEYTENTCTLYGKKMEDINGNPNYDAACANWGETWRLPTKSELEELINQCVWTWIQQSNCKGYLVIGTNGNTVFFPACGCRVPSQKETFRAGESCIYWSSTPGNVSNIAAAIVLDKYDLNSGDYIIGYQDIFYGSSIRPVSQ